MRAAICEDNPRERSILKTIINKNFNNCIIEEFSAGSDLLAYLKENSPDIILLDIEMPGINGIETARKIREKQSYVGIIFVTGYPAHALEAFGVYAVDYILKPVDENRLIASVNKVIKSIFDKRVREEDRYIELHSKGMLFMVMEKDICFIEKVYNKCCIHTKDHTYTAVKPLKHFEAILDPSCFIKTHNAFLVNKSKIAAITTRKSQNYEIHFDGLEKKALLSRGANERLRLI